MYLRIDAFFVFAIALGVVACGGGSDGGGSDSETTEITPPTIVPPEGDNSLSNELTLSLLEGVWQGSLTSFLEGTDTKQCEWDLTLNLTSRQVQGSGEVLNGVFYGDVSAELLYAFGEESEHCISDSFELDWSAFCYSAWYKSYVPSAFIAADYTCLNDMDRLGGENVDLYRSSKLSYFLNKSRLTYDETTITIGRRNRDDTKMILERQ
ncbi:hypothetical protein [Leucothrix pacifica]|uniref:Uncharacterized protein n=1 Tax=Leucothrix pacifica TaxID=1247513 RepID=A0A317CGQ8_9GAMM|nr:hypothetical protein [Leucothrix pacifica]PWQ95412.1 hypothetical protein DKW60_15145 [Leucothrix pacifica]